MFCWCYKFDRYTRLPTGHTHDDIDACFGIISKYFTALKVIDTFQDFKTGIIDAFRQSDRADHLQCVVHDPIPCLVDYMSFYDRFLDPNLERLHKEIFTMHQWRFSTIELSIRFPRGVMTQYRAYSSKKVYVIIIIPLLVLTKCNGIKIAFIATNVSFIMYIIVALAGCRV